ncbi:sulfite exporter TauE/SafE family protein [Desulfosporosinus sp. BICA1-9]|uniref:sulfite exporter TauE/SafE family protein n=1 Tax=Desulfosporosinus sp. BICA1-9 TaxID=1531958 RepID=UPI00054C69DD|nr:sulfite exporter TauE/SafE family protein [Desulfosporosinus sp. BICA1-9]KJS88647.1 MAG: membrane protein [Desulfosporosinus sp. BICA1-9]HBW38607.1 sulfite exporter TauE/SafE family protein [Desulfosporosinus sp.]
MSSVFGLMVLVLVASTLQAGTGFGFSIMATPFLLLLFEPHDAIQLNIILSLVISVIMTYKLRSEVNKESLIRLIKGSLIGIFPGMLLFIFLDVRPLKILVSILILASIALLIVKINVKQTNTNELITGALAGLLTTSLGMPGPPLLIYFAGAKVDKSTLRGTALAYFVFVLPISLLLQFSMYSISKGVWISTLWTLPFAIMGIYLGQWVFTRLKQQLFEKIIYALLFFMGIYLLLTTL